MPIDPWEALRAAVRAAHIPGVGPVRGAAVDFSGSLFSLNNSPSKGMITVYASRSSPSGESTRIYTLSDQETQGAVAAQVYWLPYVQGTNQLAAIDILNRRGATMFLTSGLSGCHFVGCDGAVVHSPAQMNPASAQQQMGRVLPTPPANTFFLISLEGRNLANSLVGTTAFYGGVAKPPQAVVMGWKSPLNQWFFAYQELTRDAAKFGYWHALRS